MCEPENSSHQQQQQKTYCTKSQEDEVKAGVAYQLTAFFLAGFCYNLYKLSAARAARVLNGTEKINLHAYHDSTTYTYKDEYRQGALSPNLPIQLSII